MSKNILMVDILHDTQFQEHNLKITNSSQVIFHTNLFQKGNMQIGFTN